MLVIPCTNRQIVRKKQGTALYFFLAIAIIHSISTTTTATKKNAHHIPALKMPSTTLQPLNKKIKAIEITTGNNICLLILIVYILNFNYCTISIRAIGGGCLFF